ncbi:MAG: hypothetical protein KKF56_00145 [Nanoarchaeota archaeon]|nr:hypothetical protein [Nanoarchaeota archaeon]
MKSKAFPKKRGIILFIFIILSINLVIASYECDDSSNLSSDQNEIEIGDRKTINGLGIGLVFSDETPQMNKYSADLILDAKKLTITNETPAENVEFITTTVTISLINSTDTNAIIAVGSSTGTIDESEQAEIGSKNIYLSSVDETTATIIIGTTKLSLSNTDNPSEILTLNGSEYLLELFSASDDNAIVKVKKCDNTSASIIEISQPTINNSINNQSSQNQSNNQSSQNNNQSQNNGNNNTDTNTTTINITDNNLTNLSESINFSAVLKKSYPYVLIFIGVVILIIVIIFVLRKALKKPKDIHFHEHNS